MKKLLLILLLISVAGMRCHAQENIPDGSGFSVRAGAAIIPSVPTVSFLVTAIVTAMSVGDDEYYKSSFMPWTSLEMQYAINNRIVVGLDLGFFTSNYKVRKKATDELVRSGEYMTLIGIMPEFRYNYLVRDLFRLYGSAEVGILYSAIGKDVMFSFQVNPIGMEVGKKFYGFAEIGAGMGYAGGRAGIGFRF